MSLSREVEHDRITMVTDRLDGATGRKRVRDITKEDINILVYLIDVMWYPARGSADQCSYIRSFFHESFSEM